jgi:hypothetical protein
MGVALPDPLASGPAAQAQVFDLRETRQRWRWSPIRPNVPRKGSDLAHYVHIASAPNMTNPTRLATPCDARFSHPVLYSGIRPSARTDAPHAAVTAAA